MKPIEYIYKNLNSFNITIFKEIVESSGETVSEDIYDYLMETPWNTNPVFLKQFGLNIDNSNEEGPRYIVKLARYGQGAEVYADDSSWKPTAEELEALVFSAMNEALGRMGYNSISEAPEEQRSEVFLTWMSIIDGEIAVYSSSGNKLYCVIEGWADISYEEIVQGVAYSEFYSFGNGFIEYEFIQPDGD